MKRKWIATMLTCTMLTAMLAGCGGDKGTDTQAPASDAPAETAQSGEAEDSAAEGDLEGEITFWHSFTQGPRLETIQ